MANASRKHSGRSGTPDKSKMTTDSKRSAKSIRPAKPAKLDDVTDAPESGEPREQGRSRGRIIDREGAPISGRQGGTPSEGSMAGKSSSGVGGGRPTPKGPRAKQIRDQSGDTANEAWEEGRQKAME